MGAPDFILENGAGREVVPSISIAGLIAYRDAMLAKVEEGCRLLREAEAIARESGIADALRYKDFHWILLGPDRHYRDINILDEKTLKGVRKRADAAAWDLLMHASGLMTLMDAKARKEWREAIDACKTLELTKENIAATFAGLHAQRGEIFERGVINCFRKLSWDYQTNKPFKLGRRIILRIRSYGHFSHERVDELEDLQRVFCILDGKPEEDHRSGLYSRLNSAERGNGAWLSRGVHEDTYMQVRWFKNGNGHITFKRPDLVDRLNQIIAKHYKGQLAFDPSVEAEAFAPVAVA
jgi:hypothetical protein